MERSERNQKLYIRENREKKTIKEKMKVGERRRKE
jgi:hypothetical protein